MEILHQDSYFNTIVFTMDGNKSLDISLFDEERNTYTQSWDLSMLLQWRRLEITFHFKNY